MEWVNLNVSNSPKRKLSIDVKRLLEESIHNAYWNETIDVDYEIIPNPMLTTGYTSDEKSTTPN